MIAMAPMPRYRQAIASMSLGRAWAHELPNKLDQAKKYGFEGIELFYEDLEYVARSIDEKVLPETLIQAAHIVRRLCDERNLEIIALQPFMHYEGLRDRTWHAERVAEMKVWLRLAKILGTNLIQIPSTFLCEEKVTGDKAVIVADMKEIAELGMKEDPTMRFAYESLAWGTYVNRWQDSWDIVQRVDMPNFGIILDTFNIAARVYADPASPSGTNPNAQADMKTSLEEMKHTIDPTKIFFVQLADAERLERPLIEGHELHDATQPPRMSWSRNCRLFYGEEAQGGYLPIKDIADVIVNDLGYAAKMASRGEDSWKRFVTDLKLNA